MTTWTSKLPSSYAVDTPWPQRTFAKYHQFRKKIDLTCVNQSSGDGGCALVRPRYDSATIKSSWTKVLRITFVGDLRVVWDSVQAAAWPKVSFSPWKPGPRGIATCQLPKGRDERAPPANYKPKNWWATIPKTGGRPTQELAGTNPKIGRPPYSLTRCSHLRACVHLPRRSRVRVRGHPWGCDVSCAENAFLCGRRSGQPSSSSLARGGTGSDSSYGPSP